MGSRCCFSCGAPIQQCSSFVVARDILKPPDSKQSVRELCGLCGVVALEQPEIVYRLLDAQDIQAS